MIYYYSYRNRLLKPNTSLGRGASVLPIGGVECKIRKILVTAERSDVSLALAFATIE
jgi:hypothetical protein